MLLLPPVPRFLLFPPLHPRLYIKQPTSATSVSEDEEEEPEWIEYKIKETNMFTVDKYQQSVVCKLDFSQRRESLRYQTAGMLDTTLRHGVLGEDDTNAHSVEHHTQVKLKKRCSTPSI